MYIWIPPKVPTSSDRAIFEQVDQKGHKAQQMVSNDNFKMLNKNIFDKYTWENMTCFSGLWVTNYPELLGAIRNTIIGVFSLDFN